MSNELPELYHRAKNGKLHVWRVWTEGEHIVTEYGTADGAKQQARRRAAAKNLGRSNETTPEEQALLEAKRMWQRKRDLNYHLSPRQALEFQLRPMLASKFEDRLDRNVTFPAHIQPKLDGLRALVFWEGERLEVQSRSGKSYREIGSVEHIARAAQELLDRALILDGEIYAHGESFQQTTSLARRYYPGLSERLLLHVFDVVEWDAFDTAWRERKRLLERFWAGVDGEQPLRLVPTETVTDQEQVYEWHRRYLETGYEGAIVRLLGGPYEPGKRSHNLLKVKSFQDEEFRIVGVHEGVGRAEGHAIFRCITEDGKDFDFIRRGTMEERARLYEERAGLIGHYLKVQFFEKSEDGIPRFPVGLGIRAPEDMDER